MNDAWEACRACVRARALENQRTDFCFPCRAGVQWDSGKTEPQVAELHRGVNPDAVGSPGMNAAAGLQKEGVPLGAWEAGFATRLALCGGWWPTEQTPRRTGVPMKDGGHDLRPTKDGVITASEMIAVAPARIPLGHGKMGFTKGWAPQGVEMATQGLHRDLGLQSSPTGRVPSDASCQGWLREGGIPRNGQLPCPTRAPQGPPAGLNGVVMAQGTGSWTRNRAPWARTAPRPARGQSSPLLSCSGWAGGGAWRAGAGPETGMQSPGRGRLEAPGRGLGWDRRVPWICSRR